MQEQQKPGLTKREKTLMTAAAAVGLFYLAFQFGFAPLSAAYNEKTAQYDDLEIKKIGIEGTLATEEAVRSRHQETVAEYHEVSAAYLLSGDETDLSRKLSDICRNNGHFVSSQSWGNPTSFIPPKPVIEGETPVEDKRKPAFSVITANFSISGGYDELKKLLDAVDRDNDVRISNLSFSGGFNENSMNIERISVTFVVTLFNGI